LPSSQLTAVAIDFNNRPGGLTMRRLGVPALVVVLLTGVVALAAGPAGAGRIASPTRVRAGAPPKFPASMAALGDSITQAYDSLGPAGFLMSEPQLSWSTGYAGAKQVNSQYLRLLAVDPKIKGHEHNDSAVGAPVSGLESQVKKAIAQKAQYVTILIGANDVCTHTISGMTSVATFTKTFTSDLASLMKGLPKGAHVYVASIPNLLHLWTILHNNPSAENAWAFDGGKLCRSMLLASNTPADRQKVLNREKAFNSALAAACKKYAACRWDKLAVFNFKFTPGDVNTLDYYHPSVTGQNRLAAITWASSWWPKSK
jgi:lysophospholipase L1-like esterase